MNFTSQWTWVMFGYGVAYGALALYASSVAVRIVRARRRLGGQL